MHFSIANGGGSSCTTDIVVSERSSETFTWTIKGFKDRFEDYSLKRVLSAPFYVVEAGGNKTTWVLEIRATQNPYSMDIQTLKVYIHNENDMDVNTNVRISLLNSQRNKCENVDHVKIIKRHNNVELCGYDWVNLRKRRSYRDNGDIVIVCVLTVVSSFISSVGPEDSGTSKHCEITKPISLLDKSHRTFSESLGQFHLSKEMSDVQIKCEDQTFDAHQLILSARSPVFRAMFQAEMKEKDSRQVVIRDLKESVIPEMLKYIYTGTCCVNDEKPDMEVVSALLGAADKYQMDVLKEMCENVLSSTLLIENALELLSLGDMHSAHDLKKNALDIIVNNAKKITKTEAWKDFAKSSPHLLIAVFEEMAATK